MAWLRSWRPYSASGPLHLAAAPFRLVAHRSVPVALKPRPAHRSAGCLPGFLPVSYRFLAGLFAVPCFACEGIRFAISVTRGAAAATLCGLADKPAISVI